MNDFQHTKAQIENTFHKVYKERLGRRALTYNLMIKYLLKRYEIAQEITIVETGTARTKGDWDGDGQSTLIWDWLVCSLNGLALSIDISEQAIETAKHQVSDRVKFKCGNSVKVLSEHAAFLQHADLLYLDSFDLNQEDTSPSWIHHLMELTACWAKLPSGCMVVVDNCVSSFVEQFMTELGITPAFQGYQTAWIKP
jgi:hypothetical protein